jgi:hypothetical protein
MKRSIVLFISLAVLISLILGGCLTLAEDITPPPEEPRSTMPAAAATATIAAEPDNQDEITPAPTVPAEEGSVVVEVQDQTGGVLLDSGLEISLEGYDQFEQVFQDFLTLPADGKVTFQEVPFEPGRVFFASIPYGGAIYRSEVVQVDQETSLTLQMQIFETTTDTSGLLIDRLHVLVEFPQPGLAQVTEIFILSNLGDKTIVSGAADEPSAEFPLPENAGSVQFEDGALGQRFLLTENGFGDTVSIPPGSGVYQVLVYYNLPYQGSRLDFEQVMNYPLNAAVVMLPAGSATLAGSNLEDLGVQSLPEAEVQLYSAQSIPRGEKLEFQLKEGSQDGTGALSRNQVLIGVAGLLGVLMIGSGIFLFFRNKKRFSEIREREHESLSQEEILDSILALEDLYKQGEISQKIFESKRAELKNQLRKTAEDDK